MNTRKYSKAQEQKVSKAVNGKRQANSGATPFYKGDIITDSFLLECKTAVTEKKSFTIKREWIDKNREEAFAMGKPHQAIVFNFGGLQNHENFYIIDEPLFQQLKNYLENQEE